MDHLLLDWKHVTAGLRGRQVALFLDYDGTLTPIVEDPEKARMRPPERSILKELASQPEFTVAVISGRQVGDLKERVNVPEIVYVGNHGFEIEGPRLRHVPPEAKKLRRFLEQIAKELGRALAGLPGIQVEDKIFTLSVHYRNARERHIPEALARFLNVLAPYFCQSRVIYTEGKKVWEVRPAVAWDKGKTVLWLLEKLRARTMRPLAPVYVGDDHTDESAFECVKRNGLAVRVTEDPHEDTQAGYYLLSPFEVYEFLKRLRKI